MTLKEFREIEKKTQQEMADILGITKSMYEKLEYKQVRPSIETLKKIQILFNEYRRPFDVNIFLQ